MSSTSPPALEKLAEQAAKDAAEAERKKSEAVAGADWTKSIAVEFKTLAEKAGDMERAYRARRDDLLKRWNAHQDEIENRLRESIVKIYPKWEELIVAGVKPAVCTTSEQRIVLAKRSGEKGANESKRDEAKAELDRAKAELATLQKLPEQLDSRLGEVAKLIAQISARVPGPDQVLAVHDFWFQLLPRHVAMRPPGAAARAEETPDALLGRPAPATPPRTVPWLMEADALKAALATAALTHRDAGTKHDEAKLRFDQAPDDLAGETKKLSELEKAEQARIEAGLRDAEKALKDSEKAVKDTVRSTLDKGGARGAGEGTPVAGSAGAGKRDGDGDGEQEQATGGGVDQTSGDAQGGRPVMPQDARPSISAPAHPAMPMA